MRRLVYSPSVKAYIRSKSLSVANKRTFIIDVSSDIVSGTVTRNDNGPSTAQLILRNRDKKYTINRQSNTPVFLPMDRITIFLTRIAGKPIQVFTGYLDSAPYMQLYPGDCMVSATCTMKKLAYTWFDPGLNFFRNFMSSRGWNYTPEGTAFNPASLSSVTGTLDASNPSSGNTSPSAISQDATAADGGFGQLLYDFLIEVAGWKPDQVLVSKLPEGVVDSVTKLITDKDSTTGTSVFDEVRSDVDALNYYLRQLMTIEATPKDSNGSSVGKIRDITEKLKEAAGDNSIPALALVYSAIALSGYDNNHYSTDQASVNGGYGIFSLRGGGSQNSTGSSQGSSILDTAGSVIEDASTALDSTRVDEEGIAATEVVIDGKEYTISELTDPKISGQVACERIIRSGKKYTGKMNLTQLHEALEIIGNRDMDHLTDQERQKIKELAESYLTGVEGDDNDFETPPSVTDDLQNISWDSSELNDVLDIAEISSRISYKLRSSSNNVSSFVYWTKKNYDNVTLSVVNSEIIRGSATNGKNVVLLTADGKKGVDSLKAVFESLKGKPQVTKKVILSSDGESSLGIEKGQQVLINGTQTSGITSDSLVNIPGWGLLVELTENPDFSSLASASGGEIVSGTLSENGSLNESTNDDFTFQQLTQIAGSAAFVGQFAFPADIMESNALTGQRALMNDMNCLDAATQLAQASMRNLMSMPDGRILSYYPDYFGGYNRQPYWWISDLEITNMGIQMNDKSLATHVYTPGQTMIPLDNSVQFMNRIASMGVATINMTDIVKHIVSPGLLGGKKIDKGWAGRFLNHFGTRVAKEEMGIIKSPFYEFLMAWNRFTRLWSETFETEVHFTYQPEVMAGGIIGFPDHGIQMYVKSVTHTFSYSNGFQTQANLIAPSIMTDANQADIENLPGFVLAGAVSPFGPPV